MHIVVERGDITQARTDAIVNAANTLLLGGGGVDGAIHAAAGPRLLEACRRLRRTTHRDGLAVGDAVATPGFDVPAAWVIHTVGPNLHRGQNDPSLLASCFTRSLDVANDIGATTVAFPAISAGAYGWAADDVARIALDAVGRWHPTPTSARPNADPISEVRFVVFTDSLLSAFRTALDRT